MLTMALLLFCENHLPGDCLGTQKRAAQVGVDDGIPLRSGHVEQCVERVDACVVD